MSYQLRHHPRARRLKLRVERDGALVVTAPPRMARRTIDRFVASRRDWIDSVRNRLAVERGHRDPAICGPRPSLIELPAVDQRWTVRYQDAPARVRVIPDADRRRLVVRGADETEAVAAALQHWLKQRARRELGPWLEALAARSGIAYNRVSFRNQRTRWGSCSSNGNISLNARLLLCRPAACEYVLIHELVHIEHPDHSPRFWKRVAELCPAYRDRSRELREVWRRLPDWI